MATETARATVGAPPPRAKSARGRIDRIEVENFKSYKGAHTIGPFKSFTSVIGPNGSGKSNLMDAISFVLGVRSAQLRGSSFKDLIYTFDLADASENRRSARVTLAYVPENEGETLFTRVIDASGTTHYEIDGSRLTAEEYNERLKSYGILVKARNFLVYQGDIEAVAQKTPKELTTLIEQISGSDEFAERYTENGRAKQRAEDEAHTSFTKKKSLMTQKKQMREQKEEAEKHLALLERINDMKVEGALFKLYHIDADIDRARDETVIVELVDAIEDRTGSSLGAFAFEDACDACDAIERRLVTSGTASVSGRGAGADDGVGDVVVAYGVMRASKSRSTDVNDVDVWGAIIRLPRAKTDALVWHCRPFAFAGAPRTPGGDDAAPSDETRVRRGDETPSEALRGVMETFEVRDWGVFGDGG